MENTQHFLCPPRITKCVTTSYLTFTLPKSYTGNRIGWFTPGEPLPLLNILLHLWLTNPRCVVVVQLSLFNSGYQVLKEQISSSPSHHLSSKHLASQRAGQPLKQQKMAWTGSVWITGKQKLAQRRRHQEQKRGSTDSSTSKLESNHCNTFTILKNQTKKRHFYIYLR